MADDDLTPLAAQITAQYPTLGKFLNNAALSYGTPRASQMGDKLETYPAWEEENPTPGRPNITVFDRSLQGQQLQDAVAADALHFMGAIDPRTGTPVDPAWLQYKQQFLNAMTPEQQAINQRAYQQEGDQRSFDDWMQQSRVDAFLRGGLFPSINPEWQRPGFYTPEQQQLLQQMNQYLRAPTTDSLMQLMMQQRGLDPAVIQMMQRMPAGAPPAPGQQAMAVPPHLPQGQESPEIIAPAPRSGDYPQNDEYGHIPPQGPALTPVQPTPEQMQALLLRLGAVA
jgi:hypothetical protein